ncbi:hypothetical protein BJ912DRAFT_928858 [Pholiota molesta]|nr:hypothetical protein BJ912DRAFT_928858 [Pholiota molesta]
MAHIESPLAVFFGGYAPQFVYNPGNPATVEFYRLCDTFGWERHSAERDTAYQAFSTALTLEFNANFGTEVDNLESWQSLARHMGIVPVPSKLKACRNQVRMSHVNLVDLVAAFARGGQARRFGSEVALSVYTKETGKFFPRKDIHAGDLLKFLLRNIITPSQDRNNGASQGRATGRSRRGRS